MSMSKKDFEVLAHAIKMSPADRDTFIDMIVDLCARSNPCFDEKRFRIASGQTYRDCCEEWTFTFPAGQWNDNIERYENCNCIEVNDGHSFKSLEKAFKLITKSGKPNVIIANTVKGKGIKEFENITAITN